MNELQAIAQRLTGAEAPEASVLATLVTAEGSSYRQPGARLLVTAGGARTGAISGGCLEEDIIVKARAVGETGRADLVTYDTTSENDLIWGVGLGCQGIVRVLIERLAPRPAWALALDENLRTGRPTNLTATWRASDPAALGTRLSGNEVKEDGVFLELVAPPPRLVIFGAGDDVQPLLRLAKEIGWRVTVADPRPAFATTVRFPSADSVVNAAATELVARANPGPDALAVVMTHHYVHDVPILRELLRRPLAYLGLLGPKKRAERMIAGLAGSGLTVTPAMQARVHAPAGLDLGGDTPAQVALSIMAEMHAAMTNRDGRPLNGRKGRIHG